PGQRPMVNPFPPDPAMTERMADRRLEMPQPFAAEDVEFLIGCLTDAGIAPVVTEVPDGGPDQALARDDLDMQVWETGSTGAMTRKQWDACDNMPSLVAEQENG